MESVDIRPNISIQDSLGEPIQEAISRIDENTFKDSATGRLFRRFHYFEFDVIQDVETGRINAGGFVRDISRIQGKGRSKQLSDFRRSGPSYEAALEYCARELMRNGGSMYPAAPTKAEIEAYMLMKIEDSSTNETRGTYVPFRVFQIVALWADKKHLLSVIELLEHINEKANAESISAYEEMKRINETLEKETAELNAKIKETETIVQMKEELIAKLTRPINIAIAKEAIYASIEGSRFFQLRYRNQEISEHNTPNCLRYINLYQANKVLKQAKEKLRQLGIVQPTEGKRKNVISREHLDRVFQIIEAISKNEDIEINEIDVRETFFINELERLRSRVQTGQVIGKIFELEYIRAHEELTPWGLIPQSTLNTYHENRKEYGIDAVRIEDDKITEIIQIKHHANTYLRREEISSFIGKCLEERYSEARKRIVLHNCILSEELRTTFNELNVVIDIVN